METHPGLPRSPFTVNGGCNCKAIRYRVSVPEFDKRPAAPYRTPGVDVGDVRLPMPVICHCNNCRSATSQIPSIGFITDVKTVSFSLVKREADTPAEGPFSSEGRDDYVPAEGVIDPRHREALQGTFLGHYRSSQGRNRWFCAHCGTPLAYSVDYDMIPEKWEWPRMLDIWLGTVDRSDLERDFMRPERALWTAKAIPWVRSGHGGIPEHPLTRIDKTMEDHDAFDSPSLLDSWKDWASKN